MHVEIRAIIWSQLQSFLSIFISGYLNYQLLHQRQFILYTQSFMAITVTGIIKQSMSKILDFTLFCFITMVIIIGGVSIIEIIKNNKESTLEIAQLKILIGKINSTLNGLNNNYQKMINEISELHSIQLSKHQKNMNILLKYSTLIPLDLSECNNEKHFQNEGNNTWKKYSNSQKILSHSNPKEHSNTLWQHFQILISQTSLSRISIGFFTQRKKNYQCCGYCKGDEMFYIYGKDSKIYYERGTYKSSSKQLPFEKISKGDVVTVFLNKYEIIWYVNSIYVGSVSFSNQKLYPFILMIDRGDTIKVRS